MIAFDAPVSAIDTVLASPELFREWLAKMPAEAEVGRPESLFACPLANYLRSRGIADPAVGPSMVRWDVRRDPRTAPRQPLPEWARRFVATLDRSLSSHPTISATYALTLLHQVTREDQGS